MNKQILTALKAKFIGVSESILTRIADKIAKNINSEEEIEAAVEKVTFQQVLESYGDSRATEASQTAVRNYEAKHNIKDGKAIEQPKPAEPKGEPKPSDDTPAWAKAIIENQKNLTDRLNRYDAQQITKSRQSKLGEITEKLPAALRKGYDRISVESLSEEDFTSLLGEVQTEVNGILGEQRSRSSVFGTPLGGQRKQPDEDLTEAQLARIKASAPKPGDQPF